MHDLALIESTASPAESGRCSHEDAPAVHRQGPRLGALLAVTACLALGACGDEERTTTTNTTPGATTETTDDGGGSELGY